ncbi:MAG: hypothetical protein V2I31_05655 [Mariniphaga sp.]|jgi:tetratricopeptide (TPR) repeat protein|nr:hypothetical protein [Mariniphaga sp.]
MPKTVFTAIFSFWVLFTAGQTIEATYRFAEQQFEAGNFQAALADYQRVAFFDSESQFQDIYHKIGDLFYATGDFGSAVRNYDMATRIEKNDSIKTEIRLKKALCFFKQNNFFFALNELLSINPPQNQFIQNKVNLYTAIAWFGVEDYKQSFSNLGKVLPDDEIPKLEEIFQQFEKTLKRFRPGKIETMSIIFPGLGQMYTGDIVSGINSVLLVGGLAVVGIWAWQTYGVIDALLSVGSWYYRYYTGGIQNARSVALEKIAHEKEETYHQIIQLVENNLSPNP